MSYTTLLFDLDNTLLDFNKAESVAIRQVLCENNYPHDDDTVKLYSKINKSFWERFERGEIPKSTIFTGRFEMFLNAINASGNPYVLSETYASHLAECHYTINNAFSVLDYLKSKKYCIYATTNGVAATQYRRIKESRLEPYFDDVFVSETVKHQKPEKEYFDFVINNIIENDINNILIIGDSQSSDILGGINSGIDTCWYNPGGISAKYYSKFQISSLEQLTTIL